MKDYELPDQYRNMVREICRGRNCLECPLNEPYKGIKPCPVDFNPENVEYVYLQLGFKPLNIDEDEIMQMLNGE